MNNEESFYKEKQKFEKEIDKLVENKKITSFLGRWRLLSIVKRARKKLKHEDYVIIRNKVMEALEHSKNSN